MIERSGSKRGTIIPDAVWRAGSPAVPSRARLARCGSAAFDDGRRSEALDDVEFVADTTGEGVEVGDSIGQPIWREPPHHGVTGLVGGVVAATSRHPRVAEHGKVQPVRSLVVSNEILDAPRG